MTQPEALRLAEQLEAIGLRGPVAAELRRLLAENEAIKAERNEDRRREYGYSQQVVDALTNERDVLLAQRDALLEALAVVLLEAEHTLLEPTRRKARAAIKSVEGEKA